jgi:hypothetical protein
VRTRFTVAVVVAFALAACGGDDDSTASSTAPPTTEARATTTSRVPATTAAVPASGTAPEYVAAIADAIRADPGFTTVPAENAQCAAQGVVDAVGVEKLRSLGLSPAQIREQQQLPQLEGNVDEREATAVTDALLRCIDFGRVIADQLEANSPVEITDEQVACLNDRIENNPDARSAIAQTFVGTVDTDNPGLDILALAAQCVPLDEVLGDDVQR